MIFSELDDRSQCTNYSASFEKGQTLVRARSLNVARLLALVASTLGRSLRRAVAGKVANFSAVVALLALGAVTRHVTVSTTGVASLSSVATAVAVAATVCATISTTLLTCVASSLGAIAGNVTNLGALVALLC